METKPFFEIEWNNIPEGAVSLHWRQGEGLIIAVWDNIVGSANNSILFYSKFPPSLNSAISEHFY